MKKLILPALLCAALTSPAAIRITMPANPSATLTVIETPIGSDSIIKQSTVTLQSARASYTPQATVPACIQFWLDNQRIATAFTASPADEIEVTVSADGTDTYKGTPLMEGITQMTVATAPIEAEAGTLQTIAQSDPQLAQAKYEELVKRYNAVFTDYLDNHPDHPAALYAMLYLEAEPFMKYYDKLSPAAKTSVLMPLVERHKAKIEEEIAAERRIAEMQNGSFTAPEFTLPDVKGKSVSLKDFRGKWVVLDFWGAWCRWCIKGFPDLKEAYKEYAGKFEVIGIDNRDTRERWKEAIAKYELPWVNVYNDVEMPEGEALLKAYAVQGFPTKVIIDPQGIIRNITVGEDPEFFTKLRELIK